MSELQPGFASVYFEVQFDKLASPALREAITIDCTQCIDNLVTPAQRESWLNLPYTGDGSPSSVLSFMTDLLADVDPNLVPVPTPKRDFYCWRSGVRTCYTTQGVLSGGKPVVLKINADGQQISCDIMLVMAVAPSVND